MFYYLKLIFQSFYDREAIRNYVKKGQGTGAMLMANAAIIAALIIGGLFITAFLSLDKDQIHAEILKHFNQVPELKVDHGELQWREGALDKYELGQGVYLTIDTTTDNPTVKKMENSTFYVTKTTLYVNDKSKHRIQPITWGDLQEAVGQDPMVINGEHLADGVIWLLHYTKAYVIILTLVGVWLWFWIGNIIIAALARLVGAVLYSETKKLEQYERRRLASIAVLPPLIVFDIAAYGFGVPSGPIRWLAVVVIAAILMKKHYNAITATEQKKVAMREIIEKTVEVEKPKKAKAKTKIAAKKPAASKKKTAVKKPVAKK